MKNDWRDSLVGNFVLVNTTSFNNTLDGAAKLEKIQSQKIERGYYMFQQYDPIALRIPSIPRTSSKIWPIKDCYPVEFNDS